MRRPKNVSIGYFTTLVLETLEPRLASFDFVISQGTWRFPNSRTYMQQWKTRQAVQTSTLVINPKIDSKKQRRIQCSLPCTTFWNFAGRNPTPQDFPELWGHVFPNPIKSSARTFH